MWVLMIYFLLSTADVGIDDLLSTTDGGIDDILFCYLPLMWVLMTFCFAI